jgi:hypothetical protein
MRTTLTLDKDVAVIVERLRRSRGSNLKEIINEALREGFKHMEDSRRKRKPFRTESVDLGRCLLGNVDNVSEILAVSESEAFR